ncbi:hypothetical protein COCVIDRAFT_30480 [Bipolaris victoriae FI3]|uniref:USP domain-containing protein n=1 Tax=Bipolaris victoriae (strain FI3) TaxID=930091 RepID=W7E2R2_BIPV3|nr:hypothetical protein COCVIDRAFT_30480 [Bipolaris victoriae FI3]
MTAQDNDLVQSVAVAAAADEPATIAPASRRDPIEDADASFTRKRPRLHGSNSLCAMSTEAHTLDNHVEMTIRSHPPSSPVRAGDDHNHSHTGDVAASPSPAPVHSPILIPSSDDEATSPPIMVVNDEDEGDNDEAVGLAVHMDPEDYFRRFPYSHVGSYTSVVRDLAQHVQDIDNDIDADFFLGLSQWLVNLPDPSVDDMQGFFVSKAAFWDDFGLLVHKVLSRRVSFTRHDHDHDHRVGDAFYSFLSAYVRTSSFLLLVDALLISQPRPDDIYPLPLISQKHLRHLHTILRSDKAPAYHMVSKEYSVDIRKMVLRLQQDFMAANGAQNLLRLANDAILQVPIGTQNHIAVFTSPVLVALGSSIFCSAIPSSAHDRTEFSRSTLLFLEKYMDDLFNLNRTAEANIARDLVQHFHALLFELCLWDKDIEADLVARFLDFRDPDSPTTSSPTEINPRTEQQDEYCQDHGSLAALVANAWKFKILRKYLMKGKMDLRVMSIGMMDSGLVEIFKQYSDNDTVPNHPVMNYLSDFLIDGKVVEYIISVDSHPQILQRSGNIIGFLVVNHRWTDSQADSIWKTIATNPDPRVVSATLTMMRAILHLMKVTDHLYLCIKLYELPISRYTINMLRFLHELSVKVVERATVEDYATRDRRAKPWNVCVRVICDTASQKETDKELLDLHNEAIEHLRGLAPHVPLDERLAIYRECADHISNHSERATGSVKVIYTLASSLRTGDGFFFQQNQDVTSKILEEIPWLVEMEKNAEPSAYQPLALRYRLELLALMICRAGSAMPAELFPTLWDHTVGSHAISNNARDWAWAQLFQTIKLIPDNEYCKQLVSSYLSKMEACFYTPGMFEFVANYNFPTVRELVATDDGVKTVLQIPGADLLWSMVLYSPEGSVEDRAARLLASRYVHINEAEGVTLADVEAAHVALVEKCMHEIRDACKTVRESYSENTIPTVSDTIRHEKEGRCRRIILFQKLLLERLRQKPEFNRAKRADSKIDEMDIPYGDAITIRFQCANGDRQAVSMGPDHTVDDLYRRLCYVSGYTKLNLFAKGHRVDVAAQAEEKLSDVDFGGQLLLQKAPEAKITRPLSGSAAGSSVFESTVTKYFDELFSLMDSNDTISQLLFDYLSFFPARNNIPDSVMTDAASSEGLFPPGKFFQARYAALALQAKLREQIRNKSSMDEKFLGKAVQNLNEALLNEKIIGATISSLQELQLAAVIVTVLLDFLRERPSPDISAGYFSDPARLADRLVSILSMALETNEDATVIQDCYGAIIEASLHSRAVWEAFVEHPETSRLHGILLLEDTRQFVREHVAKKIASVCGGDLPSTCPLAKGEVAVQFWTTISDIIPHSVRHSTQSQQLYGIADHVFRAQDEYKRDENLLRAWLAQWSDLLLVYEHKEVMGRQDTDYVVFGLTKLLLCCILSLKSFKQPVNAGNVMEQIFKKYIFTKSLPAIRASNVNIPILQSHSRREIYDLMLALVDDSSTYNDLLRLVGEVELEECETALATLSVDRSMEVRSSTGYVGLYNPRAICYANSLLTQLFMNLNFRKFMLGLELQESNGSQKLLLETQRLFTNMQHSFRRSADPRSFAACVKNSDLMPIDISVQMDADEFYNSLFDQWERQLIKEENKQEFRSFYGGQTLNQIKSKECEHVSERSEPFFAVQCDVVGKSTLQESLQAFVSGDVMEGDNKYKCESCDRYVDAVKRTCFKQVPDNLIFHLKRFEFDLADFSRRKVHDHFEFPPCIDINAYHVDSLSDPTKAHEEDIFDLVGVLVHTGTCEHGHYYSYIRERPSPAGSAASTWVEFDDSNVVPFDPADIAYRTFGGMTDDTYSRMPKQYSAYMLFYQRRTAIEEDQRKWVTSTNERTLKVPAPQALKEEVDVNNALIIQEYCQFDSNHTKFLRQLHAMSRTINHGSCSEDHGHEKQSLQIVLTHLAHIAWRHTTSDLFTETLLQLRRSVLPCAMCCNIFLKHFAIDESALFNLLVRCPHAKVRSQIRSFLIDCLKVFREKEPNLYGLEATENDMDSDSSAMATKDGLLVDIIQRLRQTADDSYQSIRGWDDFYLTLTQIVEIGHAEIAVFLNHGFLDFCIKLLSIHVHRRLQDDYPEFWRILSKKVGIYNRLVQFFSTLLSHMDTSLPLVPSTLIENRGATFDRECLKFPLTHRERQMLFYWDPELKAIAVLDKAMEMFDLTKAEYFYPGDIVKTMIGWTDPHAQSNLFKTINDGIGLDPPFCDAYVRAALSFCETSPTAESVTRLITTVSKAIASANQLEEERLPSGIAVLDFFIGLLKAENEAIFEQRHPYVFFYWVMARSRIWAPALLLNPLESVRQSAELLVSELYKDHEWPTDMVAFKWRSLRELLGEMMQRIIFEKDAGMLRIHMTPLISSCQFLLQQIFELVHSEDPDPNLDMYREDANDSARIYAWQTDIEPRLHSWPQEDNRLSADLYDQSDFGSESDVEEVAGVD